MDPLLVLLLLGGLVLASTAAAVVVRARTGRVQAGGPRVDRSLTVEGAELTLVQLSSPVCSACVIMRRVSGEIAAAEATIGHRELDVTRHADLARELGVLSTPTTLIVDAQGVIRSRIIGAAKPATVRDALADARGATIGAAA